jgi:hypothetical protein
MKLHRLEQIFILSLTFSLFYSRRALRTFIEQIMGDSMINPSIEYDYLIKFLALGDSGVGR